jgi:hypothetical protein
MTSGQGGCLPPGKNAVDRQIEVDGAVRCSLTLEREEHLLTSYGFMLTELWFCTQVNEFLLLYRCLLRRSLSEERLIGPYLSVPRIFSRR